MILLAKFSFILSLVVLISACHSEEDTIQSGYWVENDAENSLVEFSPGGKFINVRNPNSTVNYEIDGGYMILGESEEKIKLKIKKADDEADSLKSLVSESKTPEQKLDYLYELIEYNIELENVGNIFYLRTADSMAKANHLEKDLAIINLKYGIFWRTYVSLEMALPYFYRSINLFRKLNDTLNIGRVYRQLGESYRTINSDSALFYLKEAEMIFKKYNELNLLAKTYNRFSAIYREMSIYENFTGKQKLFYAKKSLKLLQNEDDKELRLNNYIMLIAIYLDYNKIDSSKIYIEKALLLIEETENHSFIPYLFHNVAKLYYKTKEYNKLIYLLDHAIEMSKERNLPLFFIRNILFDQAMAYEKIGDYKTSQKIFKELYKIERSDEVRGKEKDIIKDQLLSEKDLYERELGLRQKEIENKNSKIKYIVAIFIISIIFISAIVFIIIKRNNSIRKINSIIFEKNDRLHILNATKDKFFSIIAHDLKNPIGSFKQVTETLSVEYKNFSEEDKIEFIDNMKDASKHIYNLLENLLIWSRSQRGIIECHPEIMELSQVVSIVLDQLYIQSTAKKIKLLNKVSDQQKANIDPNLTTTIIRNLVSNAIKYSNENTIVEVLSEENNAEIIIEVKDYGVGMNETIKDALFKINDSKSTNGTSGEKGTGLGLIISKEFVEMQSGKIWVESEPGKGTSFLFTVPKE